MLLHNLCIDENVPLYSEEDNNDEDLGIFENNDLENQANSNRTSEDLIAGRRVRQNYVTRFSC